MVWKCFLDHSGWGQLSGQRIGFSNAGEPLEALIKIKFYCLGGFWGAMIGQPLHRQAVVALVALQRLRGFRGTGHGVATEHPAGGTRIWEDSPV